MTEDLTITFCGVNRSFKCTIKSFEITAKSDLIFACLGVGYDRNRIIRPEPEPEPEFRFRFAGTGSGFVNSGSGLKNRNWHFEIPVPVQKNRN